MTDTPLAKPASTSAAVVVGIVFLPREVKYVRSGTQYPDLHETKRIHLKDVH
jgi:hypothetical protein